MTRRARACRTLPTWALRKILDGNRSGAWWLAAHLELWKREVTDEVAAYADEENGPWPCVMPGGHN